MASDDKTTSPTPPPIEPQQAEAIAEAVARALAATSTPTRAYESGDLSLSSPGEEPVSRLRAWAQKSSHPLASVVNVVLLFAGVLPVLGYVWVEVDTAIEKAKSAEVAVEERADSLYQKGRLSDAQMRQFAHDTQRVIRQMYDQQQALTRQNARLAAKVRDLEKVEDKPPMQRGLLNLDILDLGAEPAADPDPSVYSPRPYSIQPELAPSAFDVTGDPAEEDAADEVPEAVKLPTPRPVY